MKERVEKRIEMLQQQYQQLKSSLLRIDDDRRKLEPLVKELEIRLNEEQQLLAVLAEDEPVPAQPVEVVAQNTNKSGRLN